MRGTMASSHALREQNWAAGTRRGAAPGFSSRARDPAPGTGGTLKPLSSKTSATPRGLCIENQDPSLPQDCPVKSAPLGVKAGGSKLPIPVKRQHPQPPTNFTEAHRRWEESFQKGKVQKKKPCTKPVPFKLSGPRATRPAALTKQTMCKTPQPGPLPPSQTTQPEISNTLELTVTKNTAQTVLQMDVHTDQSVNARPFNIAQSGHPVISRSIQSVYPLCSNTAKSVHTTLPSTAQSVHPELNANVNQRPVQAILLANPSINSVIQCMQSTVLHTTQPVPYHLTEAAQFSASSVTTAEESTHQASSKMNDFELPAPSCTAQSSKNTQLMPPTTLEMPSCMVRPRIPGVSSTEQSLHQASSYTSGIMQSALSPPAQPVYTSLSSAAPSALNTSYPVHPAPNSPNACASQSFLHRPALCDTGLSAFGALHTKSLSLSNMDQSLKNTQPSLHLNSGSMALAGHPVLSNVTQSSESASSTTANFGLYTDPNLEHNGCSASSCCGCTTLHSEEKMRQDQSVHTLTCSSRLPAQLASLTISQQGCGRMAQICRQETSDTNPGDSEGMGWSTQPQHQSVDQSVKSRQENRDQSAKPLDSGIKENPSTFSKPKPISQDNSSTALAGGVVQFSPDPVALRTILQNEGLRAGVAVGSLLERSSVRSSVRGSSVYLPQRVLVKRARPAGIVSAAAEQAMTPAQRWTPQRVPNTRSLCRKAQSVQRTPVFKETPRSQGFGGYSREPGPHNEEGVVQRLFEEKEEVQEHGQEDQGEREPEMQCTNTAPAIPQSEREGARKKGVCGGLPDPENAKVTAPFFQAPHRESVIVFSHSQRVYRGMGHQGSAQATQDGPGGGLHVPIDLNSHPHHAAEAPQTNQPPNTHHTAPLEPSVCPRDLPLAGNSAADPGSEVRWCIPAPPPGSTVRRHPALGPSIQDILLDEECAAYTCRAPNQPRPPRHTCCDPLARTLDLQDSTCFIPIFLHSYSSSLVFQSSC
ncbi:mucin-4 [Amia ocellicauda]|uniref:mucin-4 n=1 Tax=Amia ocellicauda TaxID=2972642 RepID=UPI003464AC01